MKIDMKALAERQLQEIIEAGEAHQNGEADFQKVNEVYLRNREICRVIGLRNKIAENAKKSPAKDLLEYAGVAD